MTYELGTPVTFTRHLHRRETRDRDRHAGSLKAWTPEAYPGDRDPEPRQGIVVGRRTLANGRTEWGDEETPTTFEPTEHFTAYLIAYAMNRRPVLVLPEHLEPVARLP